MIKKLIIALLTITIMLALSSCFIKPTIHITLIESDNVTNIYENHYKLWLEEQTGFNIEINEITTNFSSQYLAQIIADGSLETDIVIINSGEELAPALTEREAYGLTDSFLQLDDYIVSGTNLYSVFEEYKDAKMREYLSYDDKLYFFPAANLSRSAQNAGSLWINAEWLENLDLEAPKTTEELIDVLYAFKTGDPNGDGVADEIPLSGSVQSDDMKTHFAIINAFTYFDHTSLGMYVEDNELQFSPTEPEFREAVIFLNELYGYEYIHNSLFTLSDSGLAKIATDTDSILGMFSASHLTDIVMEEEDFSNYISIAPIMGTERNAVMETITPTPAAAILASTDKPDECFLLLDIMLSEEAYLVATYGEEGVDWIYAEDSDVDIFGDKAIIKTDKPTNGTVQNKHFDGVGLMINYPELTDGVFYTNYNLGYLDAEAYNLNEPYFRENEIGRIINSSSRLDSDTEYRFSMLENYIEMSLEKFISGELDASNDEDWQNYLDGYYAFIDIFDLVEAELDI